jgi:uncharacterized protein (TIGR01777 family)
MTFTFKIDLPYPLDIVYKWHQRPGAVQRLTPPWVRIRHYESTAGLENDSIVTLKCTVKGLPQAWKVQHFGVLPPFCFSDQALKSPFHSWTHHHRFYPNSESSCTVEDTIHCNFFRYTRLDRFLKRWVKKELETLFRYRHATLQQDLNMLLMHKSGPLKIVITGASGFIGNPLSFYLSTQGYDVKALKYTENPQPGGWNPYKGFIDRDLLEGCDAIIHLAGQTPACFWTPKQKKSIYESHVRGTQFLCSTLKNLRNPPKTLLAASGIGIYGCNPEGIITENSEIQTDSFLGNVAYQTEAATAEAAHSGIRIVHLRLGAVLSSAGGMLGKLLPLFKCGLGAKIGDGHQMISWIGLEDVLRIINFCLHHPQLSGPINIVSPHSISNELFTKTTATHLNRKSRFTLPKPLLRFVAGQMADELLLANQSVIPQKLLNCKYSFLHPTLKSVLKHTTP